MSALELALEKVKDLSESEAKALLAWLKRQKPAAMEHPVTAASGTPQGFARRYRNSPRSTADWMHELREGEL